MSTLQEIKAAIAKLSPQEFQQLVEWMEEHRLQRAQMDIEPESGS